LWVFGTLYGLPPRRQAALETLMTRIDLDEALPDEVRALREEGVPYPALYSGPVYSGNGGHDARAALEAELSGLPMSSGDEPDV